MPSFIAACQQSALQLLAKLSSSSAAAACITQLAASHTVHVTPATKMCTEKAAAAVATRYNFILQQLLWLQCLQAVLLQLLPLLLLLALSADADVVATACSAAVAGDNDTAQLL